MKNTTNQRTAFSIDFTDSEGGVDSTIFFPEDDGTITIMCPYSEPDSWANLSKEEARKEWKNMLAKPNRSRGRDVVYPAR